MTSYKFKENLLELSDSANFETAVKEWEYWDHLIKNKVEMKCLCGHTLKMAASEPNVNIYNNSITGRFITVGNECKKKFGLKKTTTPRVQFWDHLRSLGWKGEYEDIVDLIQYSEKIKEWIINKFIDSNDSDENIIPIQILIKYNCSKLIDKLLEGIKLKCNLNTIKNLIKLLSDSLDCQSNTIFNNGMEMEKKIIEELKKEQIEREMREEERRRSDMENERKRKIQERKIQEDKRREEEKEERMKNEENERICWQERKKQEHKRQQILSPGQSLISDYFSCGSV